MLNICETANRNINFSLPALSLIKMTVVLLTYKLHTGTATSCYLLIQFGY